MIVFSSYIHVYMYMYVCMYMYMYTCTPYNVHVHIQWNLSNPDTLEKKVSLLARCPYYRGCKCTQTGCLGQPNVSCLSRCPYFRGVLNEGFHCTLYLYVRGWDCNAIEYIPFLLWTVHNASCIQQQVLLYQLS